MGRGKKILIGLGVLVVVLIVAAVAAPFLIPLDTYKGRLIALVKQSTGRDLKIDGPIKLSILPQIAIAAGDVSFANAPGATEPVMMQLKELDLQVKLLPLLRGDVEIGRFVLTDPVIALEVDKTGRPNWVFAAAGPAAPGQAAQPPAAKPAAAPAAATAGAPAFALARLGLEDVRLEGGKISYRDDRTGQVQALDDIDMKLSLPDLASPFAGDGSAVWNGEKVTLTVGVAKPGALLSGGQSGVDVKLAAKPVSFDFTGNVTGLPPAQLDGTIDLAVPSIRDLAKWTGSPLPAGGGLGKLSIKGKIRMTGASFSALRIEDLRLEDGAIRYGDGPTAQALDAILLHLSLADPLQPLTAEGSALWNGEKVGLNIAVAKPQALLDGGASAFEVKLAAKPVLLDFAGNLTGLPPAKVAGTLDLAVPSLAGFGKWVGAPGMQDGSLTIHTGVALAGTASPLEDVRLDGGRISYIDGAGKAQALNELGLKLTLQNPAGPLAGDGSAVWNGEKATVHVAVAKPQGLIGGAASAVQLKLAALPLEVGFAGDVAGLPPAKLSGTAALTVPSLRGLARWTGTPIAAGAGLASVAFTGKIDLAGGSVAARRLQDFHLAEGKLSYRDAGTGKAQELDDIDLKLSLPDLDKPFAGAGSVVWNQEKVALSVGVEKPRALFEGSQSAVLMKVSARPIEIGFNGDLGGLPATRLGGTVDVAVPSLRVLAGWAGAPLAAGAGLKRLDIKGKIDVAGPKIEFNDAEINLDSMGAKGSLSVDMSGARPYLKGTLAVDKLDLNPYLPPETASGGRGREAAPASGGKGGGGGRAAEGGGWSDAPIDVSGLAAADADLTLQAGAILYRKIEIGKSALDVHLKDSKLTANLRDLELYHGKGQGKVALDGSGGVPAVTLSFNLADVQIEPLMVAAEGSDWVSGTGNVTLDVAGRGQSQRALISALNGKGSFNLVNGQLKGVNFIALAQNAASALSGIGGGSTTDFASLTGTFTITNGVLRNDDMELKSGPVPVTGAGTVDLPRQSLNYRVTAAGVPILVSGPWSNISYRPDLAGLLKGVARQPGQLLDTLKGLQGGGQGGNSSGGGGSAPASPGALLKGLFGK